MRIFALVSPPVFVRLLDVATEMRATVFRLSEWDDLTRALAAAPFGIVVIDPYWRATLSCLDVVALSRQYPTLPVVVYTTPSPAVGSALSLLARHGIHDTLIVGVTDRGRRASRVIATAARRALTQQVIGLFGPALEQLSVSAQDHLRSVLEGEGERPTVASVARACGMSRGQLAQVFADAGVPPPGRLVIGTRLAQALTALTAPAATVSGSASVVGRSRPTLHRGIRSILRQTPREAAERATTEAWWRDSDAVATRLLHWVRTGRSDDALP